MRALARFASMAPLFVWLVLGPAVTKAERHVLVLAVESAAEEDEALAQLADAMLRDAVIETPGTSLIEWTPTRASVVETCQTTRVDEACLDAVAARYHADYILVPFIERADEHDTGDRHMEARIFDAHEGTLSDAACAAIDGSTDPEVALALVEVLLGATEEDDDGAVLEVDASEGRSLRAHTTSHFGASRYTVSQPDGDRTRRSGSAQALVPSASPCASLSPLAAPGTNALCHGVRDPSPEALGVVDGAGPTGHAALASSDDHEVGDRVDRMFERIHLSGRVSRSGVRVGAKIAF